MLMNGVHLLASLKPTRLSISDERNKSKVLNQVLGFRRHGISASMSTASFPYCQIRKKWKAIGSRDSTLRRTLQEVATSSTGG